MPSLTATIQNVSTSISEIKTFGLEIEQTIPNLAEAIQEVGRSNTNIEQTIPTVNDSLSLMRDENHKYAKALYTELSHINKGQGEIAAVRGQSNDNTQHILQKIETTLSMLEQSNQALVKVLSSSTPSYAKQKSSPFSIFKKKKNKVNLDYVNGEE